MTYLDMQDLNRAAMEHLTENIRAGISLKDIKDMCEAYLLENGADSFWYWDVGAFVFSGDETAVSLSGKQYIPSDRVIQEEDIITVDLSPQCRNIWGDYARTIILEGGKAVSCVDNIRHDGWRKGLQMEQHLHDLLLSTASPDMTFEDLYFYMNAEIAKHGFVNLDFSGNLGHSIVKQKQDRIYTEKGNKAKLSSVQMFTFEPHISIPCSKYGYKMEDIYYFSNGRLEKL